jgi:tyrosine aminotransferase
MVIFLQLVGNSFEQLLKIFIGANCAREAVAKGYTHSEAPITSDDVIITSGCSHALDLSISALSECGKTILLPDPGFPLYGALCKKYNVETRTYPINMEEGVIDLKRLEEQIDKNTIAMIVNNPMNPAGIVFSKSHLEEVLKIAYKHKVGYS